MNFFSHWLKHAALNLGVAVEAIVYGILPPQLHHSPSELEGFGEHGVWWWFVEGLKGHNQTENKR